MNKEALYQKCIAFHGHSCPGLVIGYRAALFALELFGEDCQKNAKISCIAENDACGVDAVQTILGCTVGNGNLCFRLTGKQAFSFFERDSGKGTRLILKPLGAMPAKERVEYLLNSGNDVLFSIKEAGGPPPKPRKFKSLVCEKCGEETAEYFIRFENDTRVCPDCLTQYRRFN
ncbi:MAG: FmdE family protein [Spirochaetales bacterium]|jgi:formylmethanofuran dehydrogenase subunit E|nr:FmdE family protein [Spirochaetales bacterium]